MHTIINADCRNALKEIEDKTFQLIIADPPYRIKSWAGFGKKHDKTYSGIPPPDWSEWIPECLRILKDNGSMFIFEHPNNIQDFAMEAKKWDCYWRPPLIWFVNFRLSHPSKGNYNNHYEPIFWLTKSENGYLFNNKPVRGLGSHFGGDVMEVDVRTLDDAEFEAIWHQMLLENKTLNVLEASSVSKAIVPGQKPLKIIERLVEVHSNDNDMVLDPFGGSLSTRAACANHNRNSTSIEIDSETINRAKLYRDKEGSATFAK